jgi:hypothetical protein
VGRPSKTNIPVPSSIVEMSEEARAVKIHKLKNQQKALASLDDHVMEALDGLYELMRDDDKYVRLRAIEIVLKKVIPEKKIKELVGPDGGPVQIQNNIDVRQIVLHAAAELDNIDIDELIEASRNGNIKSIGINAGTEGEEEG